MSGAPRCARAAGGASASSGHAAYFGLGLELELGVGGGVGVGVGLGLGLGLGLGSGSGSGLGLGLGLGLEWARHLRVAHAYKVLGTERRPQLLAHRPDGVGSLQVICATQQPEAAVPVRKEEALAARAARVAAMRAVRGC